MGQKAKQNSPFNNPGLQAGGSMRPMGGGWAGLGMNSGGNLRRSEFANPIMRQAEDLTQRTMMLQSPEDPEVTNLIQDDSEAQLALFLSKTLTNAIMMYRQGGPPASAGPIGPPGNKPGPIGPPRGKGGAGRGARTDFTEFYASSSISGRGGGSGGGLYGLSEPLLQYQPNHASMEPPFKRKHEDW